MIKIQLPAITGDTEATTPEGREPVHVCSFTSHADITIEAGCKTFRFEFSPWFGPAMLGKRGDVVQGVPPRRSPFWPALHWWCRQGHRVEAGRCIYEIPPPERAVRIAGRHHVMLSPGDDPRAVRDKWLLSMGIEPPSVEPEVIEYPADLT